METEWLFTRIVSPQENQLPLRALLTSWFIPKHLIFALRTNQRVLVNQHYQPVNFPVTAGDTITLRFLATDFNHPPLTIIPNPDLKAPILYEDANLIVINKPRGLKTHPNQPGETNTVLNLVAGYLQHYPYMVHRLDMETSGAIIFAKNPVVVPILVKAIKLKLVTRNYLAWVHGTEIAERGTIDFPIGRDVADKRKRQVNGQNAQTAVTHYEVLDRIKDYSLVKIHLDTGRTHQIRVHLQALNHPIVGDPLYSDDNYPELLLHSSELTVPLPLSPDSITVTAAKPSAFIEFENQLKTTDES